MVMGRIDALIKNNRGFWARERAGTVGEEEDLTACQKQAK